jgi:hypothetical protein
MTPEDLQQLRRRFATEIQRQGHIKSAGLIEGLATVPREYFVGFGPWKIVRAGVYQLTPDDNPRHLYDNVLVALDERRMLNSPNCWLHTGDVCLESDPALRQGPREPVSIETRSPPTVAEELAAHG